jgi:hypothetical protein
MAALIHRIFNRAYRWTKQATRRAYACRHTPVCDESCRLDFEDEAVFVFIIAAIEEFSAIRHLDQDRVAVTINTVKFAC